MLSDQLTAKRGPLARIWLASHLERKVSKWQFIHTDLEKSIDAITTNQRHEPIALRISGQLLLGVVRIYSRKTKYLLEDCNEALVKIKIAFKKGDVTMTDIDQPVAKRNAITLPDRLTEFDILLPEPQITMNHHSDARDPVFDSLLSIPASQDFMLNEGEASLNMGNWEQGRAQFPDDWARHGSTEFGLGEVEMARRDNDPAMNENSFTMDEIGEPLDKMRLEDEDHGQDLLDFGFDFDDTPADELRQRSASVEFDMRASADTEMDASLSTLMQSGIVSDSNTDPIVFGIDDQGQTQTASTTTRRRRRLVVDKVTEIPHDDIRRNMNDTSLIVDRTANSPIPMKKDVVKVDLTQSRLSVGGDLASMFTRLGQKRPANAIQAPDTDNNMTSKEARRDTDGVAQTPLDDGAPLDFGLDDLDDFGTGFDAQEARGEDAMTAAQDEIRETTDVDASLPSDDSQWMAQSSQAPLSRGTRDTVQKLQTKFASQDRVEFGELASGIVQKSEAARLFYDVLLLSTKDMLKIKQDRPFGGIELRATSSLLAV